MSIESIIFDDFTDNLRSDGDHHEDDGSTDASLDPQSGTTFNNKPVWTPAEIAAYLNRTGAGWTDGFGNDSNNARQNNIGEGNSVITFGFFNTQLEVQQNGYVFQRANGTFAGYSEYFNFATMSTAQRDAARESMQAWDDVVAVSFREVSAGEADINFGNLASAPTTQAYAYLPDGFWENFNGGQSREIGGDVWISASQANNLFQLDEGGYGLQTMAHEIGHAIGISHPGGYNAAPGLSITYTANAEYAQDTRAYSIMSYFNANSIAGTRHFDFNISTTAYAGAPLIHDILAAQRIYGADMTTRTGDTVYGFNSNAGRDQYDFTKTPAPISAIWDAGGIDTIDTSGYATTQLINLNAGSLSSIGGVTYDTAPSFEQVNANRAAAGFGPVPRATYDANMAALLANPEVGRLTDNFGIAYGVTIENAIGGSGNDTIIGNEVANVLTGNAGADNLSGNGGNDTLNGGAGNDRLIGGDGVDYMTGGAGNDTFVAEINATKVASKKGDVSLDVILDFAAGDKIDLSGLDSNPDLAGIQAFNWGGHSSSNGAAELSIRTFGNINAAEKALGMDIDGIDGPSIYDGPVTMVFGNINGGDPEFAIALIGVSGATTADFLF